MSDIIFITTEEREDIEALISSFDNHGCGIGLDLKAQVALRRLLNALDQAEQTVQQFQDKASAS